MRMSTTFGDWLKFERAARRLSQAAVERAAEISHSHYSKLENNKIPQPQDETRERLHRVFGTTDDDLVTAGVMRTRALRQPGTGREVVIYEYVAAPDGAVGVPIGAGVPSVIAELLDRIEWTRENIDALMPLLRHIARHDAATPSPDRPARTPPAVPESSPARRGS